MALTAATGGGDGGECWKESSNRCECVNDFRFIRFVASSLFYCHKIHLTMCPFDLVLLLVKFRNFGNSFRIGILFNELSVVQMFHHFE